MVARTLTPAEPYGLPLDAGRPPGLCGCGFGMVGWGGRVRGARPVGFSEVAGGAVEAFTISGGKRSGSVRAAITGGAGEAVAGRVGAAFAAGGPVVGRVGVAGLGAP